MPIERTSVMLNDRWYKAGFAFCLGIGRKSLTMERHIMAEVTRARSTKEIFDRKTFPAERTVFDEGDAAQCAWFIETGRVAIVKERQGDRVLLGVLGPGEIFGELALIDDAPRMATATTLEPTVLVPIAREYLQRRLGKADPFIARLIRILVQNVRSITDRHVESLQSTSPITGSEASRAGKESD